MKRIENAVAWLRLLVFSIMAAFYQYIETALNQSLSKHLMTVTSILLTIVLFALISSILEYIVHNSKLVRHIIMGREFVEGEWMHTVRDSDGKLVSTGFITIIYTEGRLFISGEAWSETRFLTSFTSELSFYEAYVCTFIYEQLGTMDREIGFEMGLVGLGRYRFTPHRVSGPTACDGFFFDGSSGKVFRLLGKKLGRHERIPADPNEKQKRAQENLSSAKLAPHSPESSAL
jgi:hypothetical protein